MYQLIFYNIKNRDDGFLAESSLLVIDFAVTDINWSKCSCIKQKKQIEVIY
jgi:hypothetical protein